MPLAAIAAAAIFAGGTQAASGATKPALLRATSGSDHTTAALGAYCWRGTCVEAAGAPIDRDTLVVCSGEALRLDARTVATAVAIRPQRGHGPTEGLSGGPRRR